MAAAIRLIQLRNINRNIYLYDTFEGMSAPSEFDKKTNGEYAEIKYKKTLNKDGTSEWCYCSLDDVKKNIALTSYPQEKIHFVKGDVADTLPKNNLSKISLLRLDTDWYESTKMELETLYSKLVDGGVLIIDDYGSWEGARKAVDEFFETEKNSRILLLRVDNTGMVGVKQKR